VANLLSTLSLAVIDRASAAAAHATGLTGSQPAALTALVNFAEGEASSSLQRGLGVSQPATARILDQLVAAGLATRQRGKEGDAREVRPRLTARGRRVATQVVAARMAAAEEVLAPLSTRECQRLGELLEPLLGGLTTTRESARQLCRLCDSVACGHPARCPVTLAADRRT
jgi:DNA-binding MarR family transcriptional regulator